MERWRHHVVAVVAAAAATGSVTGTVPSEPPAVAVQAPDPAPGEAAAEIDTARLVPPLPVASPPDTAVLDATWNTGFYTSVVVDGSGVAHVAYYADGSGSVMLASCPSPCVEPAVRRIAAVPGIGTDITRVGDRLLVSYLDLDSRTVRVASCTIPGCDPVTTRAIAAVDTIGPTRLGETGTGELVVAHPALGGGLALNRCPSSDCRPGSTLELPGTGDHFDLAVTDAGTAWVVRQVESRRLALARCTATSCTEVAVSAGPGAFPSVAVADDGWVTVSYHASATHVLHVLTCAAGDLCSEVVADDHPGSGYFSAVTIRPSGLPLVAYRSESPASLVALDCRTVDCSVVARTTVDRRGSPGEHLSLASGPGSAPVIAHHDATSRTLRLATCADAGCAAAPGGAHAGESVSVGLSPIGTAVVAYRHPETLDLRVATCPAGPCPDGTAFDSGGDVGFDAELHVDGAGVASVVHRSAKGHVRLATCPVECHDPEAGELTVTGAAASLRSQVGADGATAVVATDHGGSIRLGRCADRICDPVRWIPVGQGSPNGPVATTAGDAVPEGVRDDVLVGYTDAWDATLAVCAADCRTFPVADGAFSAVDVATDDHGIVVVLRRTDGQVSVHRCPAAPCRSFTSVTLPGRHDHVAAAGAGDRVTVAALSGTGTLQVLECRRDCATVAGFEVADASWSLDVASTDTRSAVAVLGPGGPWVATCDLSGCVGATDGAALDRIDDRAGFIANQ